jgi:hypothetical protein
VKVYKVRSVDDYFVHDYCLTLSEEVAKTVYERVSSCNTKCVIEVYNLDEIPPPLTWIIYPEHVDAFEYEKTWPLDICVEDRNSDFDPEWADTECYVIKCATLDEAKQALLEQYEVEI